MFNILDHVQGHEDGDMYENLGITIQENPTDEFEALTEDQVDANKTEVNTPVDVSVEEVSYTHFGEEAIRFLGILPADCEINYVYPVHSEETVDIDGTQPLPAEKSENTELTPASVEWGKTEFEPLPDNFTRKSALLDLPDPLGQSMDGLATDDDGVVDQIINSQATMDPITQDDLSMEDDVENASDSKSLDGVKKFGRSFKDWKASKEDKKDWKGGATPNGKFKVIGGNDLEEQDEKPTLEEMQAAILDLAEEEEKFTQEIEGVEEQEAASDTELDETFEEVSDEVSDEAVEDEEEKSSFEDDLVCHDIWFVALGSSEQDHAGMKDFLSEHRKDLRGAFLINLDGIGSGDLTLITQEGLHNSRRADRRISRIIKNVAKDMDLSLMSAPYDFTDTDATPAMRTSLRCVTLMGMTSEGKAQHGSVLDNDLSEIDSRQIAETSYLVEEMIRRS